MPKKKRSLIGYVRPTKRAMSEEEEALEEPPIPPSLARLCRNFAALHHNFTVTSRQLHANFTPTSHELHATSHTRQNFGRAEMIIIWTARVGTRAKLVRKFCKRVSSFIADATDATENFLRFLHGFRRKLQRTSRPLHGNFTATSRALHRHFTRTSRELHKLHTASTLLSRRRSCDTISLGWGVKP